MEIKYLGWQSFRIQEGKKVVLTQPFSQANFPKAKADLVLLAKEISEKEKEKVSSPEGKDVFWISAPGEYEVGGIDVWGFPGGYWFKIRSVEVVFCWQIEERSIKKLAEDFTNIDILLIAVNGKKGNWQRKIKKAIEKISPAIIIPFAEEKTAANEMKGIAWVKPLLDLLDREDAKAKEKLLVKKEELSEEELKLVLLKARI